MDVSGTAFEPEEETIKVLTQEMTLYRHGPDGTIEPIKVVLKYLENEDIDEVIADKCEELFKEDKELNQTLFSGFKLGFYCTVKSRGRGFHYQMQLAGKLLIRYSLVRLGLPRMHSLLTTPIVFCSYKKDPRANTTITPLVLNISKHMSGNHTVLVRNFVGITSWSGRFSITPLDIFPRSFYGLAKTVICVKTR